jgi:hypothetical protein
MKIACRQPGEKTSGCRELQKLNNTGPFVLNTKTY